MTKEEIIAVAIREAFRCGKAEGAASQCEKAKPYAEIEGLTHLVRVHEEENRALGDIIQERDATITELRGEIERLLPCTVRETGNCSQ